MSVNLSIYFYLVAMIDRKNLDKWKFILGAEDGDTIDLSSVTSENVFF